MLPRFFLARVFVSEWTASLISLRVVSQVPMHAVGSQTAKRMTAAPPMTEEEEGMPMTYSHTAAESGSNCCPSHGVAKKWEGKLDVQHTQWGPSAKPEPFSSMLSRARPTAMGFDLLFGRIKF